MAHRPTYKRFAAPWDPTGNSHLLPDLDVGWEGGDVQALGALGGQVGVVSLGGKKWLRGSSKGMNAGDRAWAGAVRNRSPGGFVSCSRDMYLRDHFWSI